MNDNYDDIIGLPHHVSVKHKKMSMLDRAAQFAPFAALSGYDEALDKTAQGLQHRMDTTDPLYLQPYDLYYTD